LSRVFVFVVLVLGLFSSIALHAGGKLKAHDQWPQWRGPLATGVAPSGKPPVEWGEQKNIRWKTPIPGKGQSTPVVWGDRIFLTTAVPHGQASHVDADHAPGAHDNVTPSQSHRFVVMAVDRRDGNVLWETTVRDERPHEAAHVTASWASNSAVTDGEHVFAFFGSRGVYCLDMQGQIVWQKDLGDMQIRHAHGEGSSPALHEDTLIVNWDHQGESFVVALDKSSGEQRWKVARDEITSWSTPLVVPQDAGVQVVIAATKLVRAYDLATGELIWSCAGLSRNVVASPVAAAGLVYVANSYDWKAMLAIRLDKAKGDVTGTDAVVWERDRDTPYVPSPVLDGRNLCFIKHNQAFLTCVDAATGETRAGPMRLPGLRSVFASPVAAAGRLYVAARNGATAVVKLDGDYEIQAVNRLDDSFSASPAIVGDEIFLRGERFLYGIGEVPSQGIAGP
jgi:outer membrane protein assembly factor BamB